MLTIISFSSKGTWRRPALWRRHTGQESALSSLVLSFPDSTQTGWCLADGARGPQAPQLRALTATGRSLPRGCKQQHPTRESPRKHAPNCGPRAHHPPSAQEQLCGVTNSLNVGPEWYPIPGENSTKKRQQSSRCPRAN